MAMLISKCQCLRNALYIGASTVYVESHKWYSAQYVLASIFNRYPKLILLHLFTGLFRKDFSSNLRTNYSLESIVI